MIIHSFAQNGIPNSFHLVALGLGAHFFLSILLKQGFSSSTPLRGCHGPWRTFSSILDSTHYIPVSASHTHTPQCDNQKCFQPFIAKCPLEGNISPSLQLLLSNIKLSCTWTLPYEFLLQAKLFFRLYTQLASSPSTNLNKTSLILGHLPCPFNLELLSTLILSGLNTILLFI